MAHRLPRTARERAQRDGLRRKAKPARDQVGRDGRGAGGRRTMGDGGQDDEVWRRRRCELHAQGGRAEFGLRACARCAHCQIRVYARFCALDVRAGAHDAGKDARVAEMLHDVRAPSCSRGQRMRAKGRVRDLEGISPERKMLGEADEDDILVEILSWRCDICPVRWHQKLKRTCQRDFCSTSRRSVSNFVQCSSEAGILMAQCPERTVTRSRSGKILAPRPARRCAP